MNRLRLSLFIFFLSLNIEANTQMAETYELFKKGSYTTVIKLLDEIHDPKLQVNVYYLKGLSYNKLQEFDLAIVNFEKAIKSGIDVSDIHYELGQAYYAAQNMKKANEQFELSVKKNYQRDSSYYYLGYINQLLENYSEALKNYKEIVNAPLGIGQSATFQMGEIYLVEAELKEDKSKIRSDVEKKVIPLFEVAYEDDESSATGKQIQKRLNEVKEKYDLDENKMRNGRVLSAKRFQLKLKESVESDSNVVSEATESTAKAEYTSSIISKSDFNIKHLFSFFRLLEVTPENRMTYTYHTTHRSNHDIIKNDAYSIQPKVKLGLEHFLFQKMATLTFDTEFNYTAKDDQANKSRRYYGRTWTHSLEEKLSFFKIGDSTLKVKRKDFDARVASSDSYTNSLSFIQLASLPASHLLMVLLNSDFTTNYKEKNNSQNSYMARFDYIIPKFFVERLQFSGAFAYTLTDTKLKKSTRGTEKTLNPSVTLSYKMPKYFEFSFRYDYTDNISKDKGGYDYKKHLICLDFEMSL